MVVLARIDQRLIHGLVVNQWAPALQVKSYDLVTEYFDYPVGRIYDN